MLPALFPFFFTLNPIFPLFYQIFTLTDLNAITSTFVPPLHLDPSPSTVTSIKLIGFANYLSQVAFDKMWFRELWIEDLGASKMYGWV